MAIGILYHRLEYGIDPFIARDFAQTAEKTGFSFISAYEHILGVYPERAGGFPKPIKFESSVLESITLLTYLAVAAPRSGFLTRVLVLPQRQAALVAKQVQW
jgi:alkanesulfonate monooxygenase SsuD/methylene tetrahydromethanopterin reductase-like flavin-dependent oxidoreductase (luciferase family)